MAEISTLDSSKVIPKDLEIKSQPDTDKNFTLVTITNLKLNKTYAAQFQYVYKDKVLSEWSPTYIIITNNELTPSAPTGITVPSTGVGNIPVELSSFPLNAKRVDVFVIGGSYGTGKVAGTFLKAGKILIPADAGTYQVQLITVTPANITGAASQTYTITVTGVAGEAIENPTNPNGFTINRMLSGIEVVWAGTYANGTFTGFKAVKIYVGNSPTATPGTYREAGIMTGNKVRNSFVIPVDGTYLRYEQPVYIHAAAINANDVEGTLQQNVASNALGARSAVASDLADQIITNAKLVDDAVTSAKIAINSITNTKIADDAISTPKLQALAITSDKIVSSAITADKIATNAVTATKILAGTIDVTKLSAGTISVNNLESGTLSATSFIRAGSTTGGARVEISSAAISGGPSAGFYIYNPQGTAVLSAPLTGGLTVTGDLYANNGAFSVVGGHLNTTSANIGNWILNSGRFVSTNDTFPKITLDPSVSGTNPQIILRSVAGSSESGNVVKLNTTDGIRVGPFNSPKFTVSMDGTMVADSATITGKIISTGSSPASPLSGTLTIDSGWIEHTSYMYMQAQSFFAIKTLSSFQVDAGSDLFGAFQMTMGDNLFYVGSGTGSTDACIRLVPQGGVNPGVQIYGIDFQKDPTANNGFVGSTVTVLAGQLRQGRSFFQGAASSATTIDSLVSAQVGDIYFSTA